MKIRRFFGNDFKETLALVKSELGPDAVIMSAQTVKKGFGLMKGRVEITAALDHTQPPARHEGEGPVAQARERLATAAEGRESFANSLGTALDSEGRRDGLDEVLREVRNLRGELMPLLKGIGQKEMFPLVRLGMDEQLAAHLLERAGSTDAGDVLRTIAGDVKVGKNGKESKRVSIFVGPTGVGKTTTMAKIAAGHVADGRRVVLTSFDVFRPGAEAQMKSFSSKLGMPFKPLDSVQELFDLLTHTEDAVLIDTPGRSPSRSGFLDGLLSFQFTDVPIHTYLLLGANTDPEANLSLYRKYSGLRVDSLIFTKIDEAVRFGALYNLAMVSGKPVSHLTNGQNVPDDIMRPDNHELANLIVGGNIG